MVGHLEHVGAAAVAREEQGTCRTVHSKSLSLDMECLAEVLVGRGGVANVQPNRLPDPDGLPDRDRTGLTVGADDRPHEKVPALVLGPVLVDDEADQHSRDGELALVLRQ